MQRATVANVTPKELRSFGLILAGGLCLFFGILIPWIWDFAAPMWPWIAGGAFAGLGLIAPVALKPLYKVWMLLGFILGWINTRLLLGLVFFILLMPTGLIMRLFGGDPMRRKPDAHLNSYRVESNKVPVERLEKPF